MLTGTTIAVLSLKPAGPHCRARFPLARQGPATQPARPNAGHEAPVPGTGTCKRACCLGKYRRCY